MIAVAGDRGTIVAIASSLAPARRGIVRISGDRAVEVLTAMAIGFVPRRGERAYREAVRLGLGVPLCQVDAAALVWPTGRSYTGSPSVEIHAVGSLPILESIVAAAIAAGARPAAAGEFTMRAFLAGRIDLTQAEAVLGVIDATDRERLDAALEQLAGNVSRPLREVRDRLLDLLADIEAGLDFVDEDIEFIDDAAIARGLRESREVIDAVAKQLRGRHRATAIPDVVLRGLPNVGKSSLLNALAGRDVAIVSDIAGTTRDVVWHELEIGEGRIRLIDTAGIEEERDEIARQSGELGRKSEREGALTLVCVDCGDADESVGVGGSVGVGSSTASRLMVATRCDREVDRVRLGRLRQAGWVLTSAATGEGLGALRRRIVAALGGQVAGEELGVAATAARCGDAIGRASAGLANAAELLDRRAGHEWVAGEIRVALQAIGEVTGEIYTDDILDRVFSRFCIGK
jgi:tRNA modification GTPase